MLSYQGHGVSKAVSRAHSSVARTPFNVPVGDGVSESVRVRSAVAVSVSVTLVGV